ncbi:glutamate racemase [Cocleimonas sp. KMM 6892]|uniref:glutamate racemase n=1 Tax=unclassified Cocleimonas TaxID=2639732 RepID=UPI002DB6CF5E|nr:MULTISPECIES: glutamate racemase [unclassified Cocleimonas]MEB8431782.1 glutamate racemase [Cocleimonas sp. KMM 6892]MEC4715132.1 glutamate racemase [Cocleimonas sp. KMM 6895]MEC4744054.1 glutamate racemase [Cocleimonas sp. KMM 6896]
MSFSMGDSGDLCPIGVFDSGLGGLSVLREIHQLLPHENLIYVGDSAHAPYGDNSAEYVRNRSLIVSEFLLDQGVKAIVVACNTATAEAIDLLRVTLDVPVIGLEPAIKPASKLSKNGIIGVLATQRTINSERLLGLTEQYAADKRVLAQACPGLVEQVEACELESEKTKDLLKHYITPLLTEGVDALILGCTHYPFLIDAIRDITNGIGAGINKDKKIEILETGKPVAVQLQRVLEQHDLQRIVHGNTDSAGEKQNHLGNISFYNSSKDPVTLNSMKQLWQRSLQKSINPIAIKALPALEYGHD